MANYILSEEVLRKVLDALVYRSDGYAKEAGDTLRKILASPPAKPVVWYDEKLRIAYRTNDYGTDIPLYRKDL